MTDLMTKPVVDPDSPATARRGRSTAGSAGIPTWVLWLIVIVWCVPTLGLLVNSFRSRDEQRASGWWSVFTGNFDGFTLDNYREVLSASARAA